jgi:hypothetical protein
VLQEFKGLFFIAFFSSRDGQAETETVLSDVVLLRRDILEPPGKAGRKGGNGNGPGSQVSGNANTS